jgi:ubiquinone/menaquinone biosynthesis C-methylase UbiE
MENNMDQWFKGFQNLDASAEVNTLLGCLEIADVLPDIIQYRRKMIELCPIKPGHRVLDVGCGLGQEAKRLSALVGESGQVIGLDRSKEMVDEAARRVESDGIQVEFVVDDVHRMKFEDGLFDLARTERVLIYVDDPAQAISEMARVIKLGGFLIAYEFDFQGFFIDSDMPDLTRRIEGALPSAPPNPYIARQLPHYYRMAGLQIQAIEPFTVRMPIETVRNVYGVAIDGAVEAGKISQKEVDDWWDDQTKRAEAGQSFFAHSGFIVAGQKV